MRMRGSARMARAMETRCFWPPESLTPRSPTTVSYFFSKDSANSSTRAMRQAASTSSSVAFSKPHATEEEVLAACRIAQKQKRFLQHDAELRAVGAELHGRQVDAVHQDGAA